MPEQESIGIIRFGVFEADFRAGELRRNGSKIRLQDQPFQVLALLVAKPGEIVTREELQSKLWPADTFVDFEHGLNAAVKRLRDALGDSADNPRFIETLARRGYRFIAPINEGAIASKGQRSTGQRAIITRQLQGAGHTAKYWLAAVTIFLVLHFGILVGWQAGHRSSASMRFAERRLTANPENDPVLSAAISPDGKYLAFADRTGMFLRLVSSGETHPVAIPDMGRVYASSKEPGPLNLSWFPDDSHVLVTRGASDSWGGTGGKGGKPSLWAISVFGGQPRKIMDEAALGAVSPDGSQIAFVRGDFGHQEICVIQSDGTQPHKILSQPGANYESVVWAPDGHAVGYIQVVFISGWHQADVSLGVVDVNSGKSSSVLSTDRLRGALAWTGDGRLIYSLAEPPPNQNDSNLWAIKVDAHGKQNWGQAVRLTAGPDAKVRASVSADGKRLIFLRWAESPVVYISEVTGRLSSTHLSSLQRLSLDERENYPYTWTPDGKSVIFTSDRDGVTHLFKQGIDQPAPDLLVGGDRPVLVARLNPSGSEILYSLSSASSDADRRMRIMRVPVAGGTPQLVLAETGINNLQCARLPSKVCVFSEYTPDHVALYTFDPVTGNKAPLKRMDDSEWYLQNWTLSPDGSTLALAKRHRIPGVAEIRLFPLSGGKERVLTLRPWTGIACLDWAADGRSLWVNASSPAGVPTLLNVDLHGRASPVLEESEKDLGWAIPSPDGRHLAIWEASGNSNAWLLEGF